MRLTFACSPPCRLYGVQYPFPQIHFFTYDDRLGWRGRSLYVDPYLNPYGHQLLAEGIANLIKE